MATLEVTDERELESNEDIIEIEFTVKFEAGDVAKKIQFADEIAKNVEAGGDANTLKDAYHIPRETYEDTARMNAKMTAIEGQLQEKYSDPVTVARGAFASRYVGRKKL